MPDTLAQAIDYGRDVAKDNAIIKSTEHDRRRKFEQAVENQHMLAVRTAEEMKKLVLVGTKGSRMTELDDFAKGQVDPQLQLVLIARDNFLAAEDPTSKLGFYKAMRDVFLNVDTKTMQVLEIAMKERHHREKLEALERKAGMAEPSDDEVDAALEGI